MITNNYNEKIELENLLQEMQLVYEWSTTTINLYKLVWKQYLKFHNKTLTALIQEAETDEENIIKVNKRAIKQRITTYIIYMKQQGYKNSSLKNYLAKILKVYKYLDIEIPTIPPIKDDKKETFKDLPTHNEIKEAILHSRTKMKAMITFIASSGLRRSDVANLTINDFMEATKEYHNIYTDVLTFLKEIKKYDYIIPVWEVTTIKTKTNHITFSSPESTKYMIQMLQERLLLKQVNPTDTLFEIQKGTISANFRNINNRMAFGYKEDHIRFHPHALRKFFATTLNNNDVDYLSTEFLLGHSLKGSDSSYYFANPDKLKLKYSRVLDKLTFTMNISYLDIDSKEKMELEALKRKYKEANKRILNLEESLNLITRDIKI